MHARLNLALAMLLTGCQTLSRCELSRCELSRCEQPAPCCAVMASNRPAVVDRACCVPAPIRQPQPIAGCAPIPDWRETRRQDLREFLPDVWEDIEHLGTRRTAVALGAALGASLLVRETLDDPVRDNTQRHPERWGTTGEVLGYLGDAQVQVPVLLGMYSYALAHQDDQLYPFSKTLIRAYTVTGLSTLTVKAIANTDRPSDDWNGGQFGFPSFHVASATCIAAVADSYYGPRVGLPAYALAGLVGWTRIDQRDHDLSDIVFGTALGFIIGKSMAHLEISGPRNWRLRSLADAQSNTQGIALEVAY